MNKRSIKNTRVNMEVQRELSVLISRELKDPRVHSMTSILSAEVAPDLKTAKIYISVLGNDDEKTDTIEGLNSASTYLRGQLAKNLNLRNTPKLDFILSNSIEYGVDMSKKINEVIQSEEEE